jgi:ankyrin repeat protein
MKIKKGLIVGLVALVVVCAPIFVVAAQPASELPAWLGEIGSLAQAKLDLGRFDINMRDSDGLTGVMLAAKRGDIEMLQLLLDNGADPNLTSNDKDKNTALHYACYYDNYADPVTIVNILLSHGAKAEVYNAQGYTPLHNLLQILVSNEDKRMIIARMLKSYGANINARTKRGNTMLHLAVTQIDGTWIHMMKDAFGAELDVTLRNNFGLTPRELAIDLGQGDVATVLSTMPQAMETQVDTHAVDAQGRTSLMLAIIRGDVEAARKLLAQRANPNAKAQGDGNKTPLHYAAMHKAKALELVNLMLEYRVDVGAQDDLGNTPLHYVPGGNNAPQVARLLIERGANPNAQNKAGDTVVHNAVKQQDTSLIAYLKPLINNKKQNHVGQTASDLARQLKNGVLIKALEA